MTSQIVAALLEAYTETLQFWGELLKAMPEKTRAEYASMIAERELWWQEHVWQPLGRFIAGDAEEEQP